MGDGCASPEGLGGGGGGGRRRRRRELHVVQKPPVGGNQRSWRGGRRRRRRRRTLGQEIVGGEKTWAAKHRNGIVCTATHCSTKAWNATSKIKKVCACIHTLTVAGIVLDTSLESCTRCGLCSEAE